MSWFRTDDGWWRSRKVARPRLSLAARGLWITAGTWSSDQGTDGHITPADLEDCAGMVAPTTTLTKLAAELVRAGLWEVAPDGWQYHDWADYNPLSSQVEARRTNWASSGARGNCIRWHGPECRCWQDPAKPSPTRSPTRSPT